MDDRETKANISFLINLAKTSFSEIDRKYSFYRGRSFHALSRLDAKAEKAIISILRVKLGKHDFRVHPYALWPRRYRDNGTRLPQESLLANYRNLESESPRQKAEGE